MTLHVYNIETQYFGIIYLLCNIISRAMAIQRAKCLHSLFDSQHMNKGAHMRCYPIAHIRFIYAYMRVRSSMKSDIYILMRYWVVLCVCQSVHAL